MKLKSTLVLLVILIGLGVYFFVFDTPELPPEKEEPRIFLWNVRMDEIDHIEVSLPREDKSEAFIKISRENTFPWYFDDPQRSEVDSARWGGGIPLLLSGPGVERVISRNTTEEKLTEFGLTEPLMEITITMENGDVINIKVGDKTPDDINYYVQAPGSNDVALVDYTWYEVLERLVNEPPYAPPAED